MPVGAKRAPVDPGIADRLDDLRRRQPEHPRNDRGGGHTHQQNMIQAGPIECVFQGQHALDLVGPDHGGQDIAHLQRRPARPAGPHGRANRRWPGSLPDCPKDAPIQPPARCRCNPASGSWYRDRRPPAPDQARSRCRGRVPRRGELRRERQGPRASHTAETPTPRARNRDCPSKTAARSRRLLRGSRRQRRRTRQFVRVRRPAAGYAPKKTPWVVISQGFHDPRVSRRPVVPDQCTARRDGSSDCRHAAR